MLKNLEINKVLFLDIETVPMVERWENLSEDWKKLWQKKISYQLKEDETAEEMFYRRAGIMAEFGRIVCISFGVIVKGEKLRVKSFYGDDEKKILEDFIELLNSPYFAAGLILCAHNGKEFDFPFLGRRILVHGLSLPNALSIQGKKPWEVQHLDTMELWKFGDYKHYTSLDLLAAIFGIPTPKDDIDGSQVAEVYYQEKDLERIRKYCEKDVLTLVQVFRKFRNETLIELE